MIPFNWQSTIT